MTKQQAWERFGREGSWVGLCRMIGGEQHWEADVKEGDTLAKGHGPTPEAAIADALDVDQAGAEGAARTEAGDGWEVCTDAPREATDLMRTAGWPVTW